MNFIPKTYCCSEKCTNFDDLYTNLTTTNSRWLSIHPRFSGASNRHYNVSESNNAKDILKQYIHLPAYNYEFSLCGLWSYACPDVHGEQSAAAVENGGQRRHESS